MADKYEAEINGYHFVLESPDTIEVWETRDDELPLSYINVKGEIKSEKDFHYEIMDWYAKYVN